MREPKCCWPLYVGSTRKITRTSSTRFRSADSTPRAIAVPLPPSRGSLNVQKIVRSVAKVGLSATSSSPPCPAAATGRIPSIGSPTLPGRRDEPQPPRPLRDEQRPSGSGSTDHGCSSPFASDDDVERDVRRSRRRCASAPGTPASDPVAFGGRVSIGVQLAGSAVAAGSAGRAARALRRGRGAGDERGDHAADVASARARGRMLIHEHRGSEESVEDASTRKLVAQSGSRGGIDFGARIFTFMSAEGPV